MSVVVSALKLAAIAQMTVLTTGAIGALCAHHGIFEVVVLKKMSKLLTKVLLPALALSFFSRYSVEVIEEYGIVFVVATAHLLIGIAIGHAAAFVCGVKSPFIQVVGLMSGLPHPALPLVMLPAILINWEAVKGDASAEGNGMSTIGIYLTMILLLFATVVNGIVSTMSSSGGQAAVLGPQKPLLERLFKLAAGVDHTLYCCAGALIIGVLPALKDIFMPGGLMSWLASAIASTGKLSPALSVYIIGGLIFNTQKAKAAGMQALKEKEAKSATTAQMAKSAPVTTTPSTLEAGAASALPQLSEKQMADYKEAFSMFDEDGGGDVSVTELGAVMKSLGVELEDDAVAKMIKEVDVDGGGTIDFNEFCVLMQKQQGDGAGSQLSTAVASVQEELAGMETEGGTKANRAALLRARWERQRLAAKMWTAAFAEDDKVTSLGGAAQVSLGERKVNKAEPPSMNLFIAVCCVMKLLVMPGVCLVLNHTLHAAGVIPDNMMMRLILDIYPAIPTAAALVARFSAGGFDDAARYCATTMLPMYLLSIPSIAIYIMLSLMLIGDAEVAAVATNSTA